MKTKVCLVIFFNHRYEANIPKLYQYYGDRFENIRIIIPFYTSPTDQRVIPVYENSLNFQGLFSQAYPRLKAEDFSHYIFVGDDCILNDSLNQDNILGALRQDEYGSFITHIETLTSVSMFWLNFNEQNMGFRTAGVEYLREIPDPATAMNLYRLHDDFQNLDDSSFWDYKTITRSSEFVVRVLKKLYRQVFKREIKISNAYFLKTHRRLPYPLLRGYADFFIIKGQDLEQFCHLCGIFAAMRMHAEIAVPTALAMASTRIAQTRDTEFSFKAFWGEARSTQLQALKRECQDSVKNLFTGERQKMLFYHPIKLSLWKLE